MSMLNLIHYFCAVILVIMLMFYTLCCWYWFCYWCCRPVACGLLPFSLVLCSNVCKCFLIVVLVHITSRMLLTSSSVWNRLWFTVSILGSHSSHNGQWSHSKHNGNWSPLDINGRCSNIIEGNQITVIMEDSEMLFQNQTV